MSENQGRGRQKGQVKELTLIKDPAFGPYYIQVDAGSYILIKTLDKGRLSNEGYYTSLESAVRAIIRTNMTDKAKVFTLNEFLTEYKKETEKFINILTV